MILIFVYIKKIIIMDYLNLNEIGQKCPSALTQKPSKHLSHIYRFIPTTEVMDILGEQGWEPTQAVQTKTRKGYESSAPYKKHMIRFRNESHIIFLFLNVFSIASLKSFSFAMKAIAGFAMSSLSKVTELLKVLSKIFMLLMSLRESKNLEGKPKDLSQSTEDGDNAKVLFFNLEVFSN